MDEELKLLIFTLDDQPFAVDIKEVERILTYETPTKLPESPEFLEGVIDYGEGVIPVLSLMKKFNKNDVEGKKESIIVTRYEDKVLGIVVSAVSEVQSIHDNAIEKTPEISISVSSRYIKGLIKDKKRSRIIILLDFSKILSEEEKEKI